MREHGLSMESSIYSNLGANYEARTKDQPGTRTRLIRAEKQLHRGHIRIGTYHQSGVNIIPTLI
jgi:hypothetical protein